MIGNSAGNITYFNPLQIPGLKLWLDAMDPAANGTQPSGGTPVSSWVDKSGNGNTVTQSNGFFKPLYNSTGFNGKNSITFDGVDDLLQNTSATALGNTNAIFIASDIQTNGTNKGTFFDYSTNVATNTGINIFVESGGSIHWQSNLFDGIINSASSGTITLPQTKVLYVYNDGANAFIFVNGVQVATVTCGNIVNTGTRVYTVGSLFGGIANYFLKADVGEILAYTPLPTSAQRTLINRYLGNKWGISQP
jgi:hypothetical protein